MSAKRTAHGVPEGAGENRQTAFQVAQKRLQDAMQCSVTKCQRPAWWIGTDHNGVDRHYCVKHKYERRTLITTWRER